MASLVGPVIAACIICAVPSPQSILVGSQDDFALQTAERSTLVLQVEMRHPSSRKYVAGPWPRFALEMLA